MHEATINMSETPGESGSLADRISKPDKPNPTADVFQPKSGTSWADEVASPAAETPSQIPESSDAIPQVDGATSPFGGSTLQEPDYKVEVKLADMQADPNNPLFSATSFEQLGL